MKISEIPKELRPREKAMQTGVSSLSDRELLALFIRFGTKKKSALDVADLVIKQAGSLSGLNRVRFEKLIEIEGIRDTKAIELLALVEISSRIVQPRQGDYIQIEEPTNLVNWLNLQIGYEKQEYFVAIYLDKQNRLVAHSELFKGTLDRSVVHPREIFKDAVRYSASRIILVHNHPSGSLSPSESDVLTTELLVDAGNMLGVHVLDHLIVSEGGYVSLRMHSPHLFDS